MFYVHIKKILLSLYMHELLYLFCTHYPLGICFIAVILNTQYAFYVLYLFALHLFVENSSDELMLSNSHVNEVK